MNEQRSWGQRLWWLQPDLAIRWSSEERWTRGAIWVIAFALWIVPFWTVYAIASDLGIGRHVSAAIALFATMPPAVWLARVIAVRTWPEAVRLADEKAASRITAERSQEGLMEMTRKLWLGAYSLPATFWAAYVLGGLIVAGVATRIAIICIKVQASSIGLSLAIMLCSAYLLLASVGVWRSARTYRGHVLCKAGARLVVAGVAASALGWIADAGPAALASALTM